MVLGIGEGFEVEADDWAGDDGDGGGLEASGAVGEGFVGTEDAHGEDGDFGFGDDEPSAWLAALEMAVGGAGAFGEDDDAFPFFEETDDGFEAGEACAVLVDGDDVEFGEEPACEGVGVEGFAGEVVDGVVEGSADEGRVEVADVIGADEGWAVFDEVFPAGDLEIERGAADGLGEIVTEIVHETHGGGDTRTVRVRNRGADWWVGVGDGKRLAFWWEAVRIGGVRRECART